MALCRNVLCVDCIQQATLADCLVLKWADRSVLGHTFRVALERLVELEQVKIRRVSAHTRATSAGQLELE